MRSKNPWFVLALALAPMAACHDPVPLLWKYEGAAANPTSPLVTGSYLAFGHDAGVTLLTPDGDLMCSFDAHGRVAATPRTDGRLLFFGSTNHVFYAIDSTCKLAWKLTTGDRIKSSPVVAAGVVYFGSADGHVYATEGATGGIRWTFPPMPVAHMEMAQLTAPAPEAAHEAAAPAKNKTKGGKGKGKGKGKNKGKGKETHGRMAQAPLLPRKVVTPPMSNLPLPLVPHDVGPFVGSSPTVAEGVLYIGSADHFLYAINTADGSLKWRFATEGEVHAAPLVADGVVYFGSRDGDIYAVNLATHQLVWKVPTLDEVRAPAKLAERVLYTGGSDHHVYAIDPSKGQIRWKYETKGPVLAGVGLYKGIVLAGGGIGDGMLYAVKLADQALFWSFQTHGEVESEPVVVEDRAYVASSDGMIYAFNLAQAPQA